MSDIGHVSNDNAPDNQFLNNQQDNSNDNENNPTNPASLSDDEFQFLKNKLQTQVKEYLNLEEQITALVKGAKERRTRKNEVSQDIMEIMAQMGIDDLTINEGRLVSKTTIHSKSLSKNALSSGLNEIFQGDNEKLQNAIQVIFSKREQIERKSLKHLKPKAKNKKSSLNMLD